MELKRVVVTGLGAVTLLGNTPEETWENMVKGVSGAAPITLFDATNFKTQFACEVKNWNPNEWIDRKDARKMDRYAQLAMASAVQGVKDSGLDLDQVDKNRVGVIYGVGIGGIKTFEEEASYYALNKEKGPRFSPFFIPKMIADIAAGQISIHFGFHGPNFTTTSACASSTNALADAFNLLRLGKADVIVAGGAEAAICECGVGGFNAMKALSARNDDPTHASRPFSASRDGFVMGEGAGCLILEELEHAKARGPESTPRDGGRGRECRRLSPHGFPSRGTGCETGDGGRPGRRPDAAGGYRLYQRARHVHPCGRHLRGQGHQGGLRRARLQAQYLLHEVYDGPLAPELLEP